MSRRLTYPLVDGRRARKLRETLLRDMAALAPEWRAIQEAAGPDRALAEIAALLLEQTTVRLDKTPERDALAFLDFFNVPLPQPRSAEGFAVFALADDAIESQTVGLRTPLDIPSGNGEAVRFETAEALPLHAARIVHLGTVDPASDRIGEAPGATTAFERDEGAPGVYRLAASAAADDTVIRLEYSTGLEPGDLLRIRHPETGAVRIRPVSEVGEDGLVTLAVPVGDGGLDIGQGEEIVRMTWLDAFRMPDAQEHAIYLGDDALFDVKEPAQFTLRVEGIAPEGAFAQERFVVELYGLRDFEEDPDTEPDWHRLPLVSSNGTQFTYLKAWPGPVIPLEIAPDRKARWLRLRRLGAILPGDDTAAGPDLSVTRIAVQASTEKPDIGSGSVAVAQAVHNATPLPVTSAFLPFGPEPQRFDVFALAAPETFSKHGATATLQFNLVDATLENLAASIRIDSRRRAYGAGRNGRIQILDFAKGETQFWREAAGPEAGGQTLLVSGDAIPRAAQVSASGDLVAAVVMSADGQGVLQTTRVRRDDGESEAVVDPWQAVPERPDARDWTNSQALAVTPFIKDQASAQLLLVNASGVFRIRYGSVANRIDGNWQNITPAGGPSLDNTVRVVAVPGSFTGGSGDVLVTDDAGQVWILRFTDGSPDWVQPEDAGGVKFICAPGTMPTALSWQVGVQPATVRHLAIAVIQDNQKFRFGEFVEGNPPKPSVEEDVPNGSYLTLLNGSILPDVPSTDALGRPSLLVVSPDGSPPKIDEWHFPGDVPETVVQPIQRSIPVIGESGPSLISFPASGDEPALLLLPGKDETLVKLEVQPSRRVELMSWIPTVQDPVAADLMVQYFRAALGGPFEELMEPREIARSQDGSTRFVGISDPVDTDSDMALLQTTAEWNATLQMDGATPRLRYHKSAMTLPGETGVFPWTPADLMIIAIKTPGGGDKVFKRFKVKEVEEDGDHRRISVEDDAALEAFDNDNPGALSLRAYEPANPQHVVVPANSHDNYATLAVAHGDNDALEAIALPDDLSKTIPVKTKLDGVLGGVAAAILPRWSGPPPVITWSKAVSDKYPAQAIVAEPLDRNYQGPELSWEYFDGEGWNRLDKDFRDETDNLVSSGAISFAIPEDLSKVDIAGQEELWIRARLIGGDYGRPRYVVDTTFEGGNPVRQSVSVDTSQMRPPEVAAVGSFFGPTPAAPPALVVARNNARDIDQSAANRLDTASYPVFEGVHETPLNTEGGKRALMLGLSRPLPPGLATLFARVIDRASGTKITIQTLKSDLTWVTAPLVGRDPTQGLTRSGLIRFDNNARMMPANLLGKSLCWLRIVADDPGWLPEIHGLWLNGTRVVQAETVVQELLGTSLGEPGTRFRLLKSPVVENSLELRVRERLGSEVVEALRAKRRDGEPDPVLDKVANIPGQWVLWRQADTLLGRGGAREFLLAPDGTVQFGDGANGAIPPAIRDGIRAFRYQAGGVTVDTPEWSEVKPKVQIPKFDLAFVPEAIAGGTQEPTPERLLSRIPGAIRHQGNAVSLADVEAVARDLDNQIVQVSALPPAAAGGAVRVFVLARGAGRLPVYSLSRCEALARALGEHMTDAYPGICLEVRSVAYRKLKVRVGLVTGSGAGVTLGAHAGALLERFLDPVAGGPCGDGWPPGRRPVPLDIERALAGLEGLLSVSDIAIDWKDERNPGPLAAGEVVALEERADLDIDIAEEDAE